MVNLIILILSLWFMYACYMHSIEIKAFIYKAVDFHNEMLGDKPTIGEFINLLRKS